MTLHELISAAKGSTPVDLLLANARILNVFSGEILDGNIAVLDGVIVGFGNYPAKNVVDLHRKIVTPGFIDPHLHIESAMVAVTEFAKAILPLGTTTVVADPHEIANVHGAAGIRYMLESAEDLPVNVYYTLPSCVPATDLETAGATLSAEDLAPFIKHPRIIALAEMMNFPGVVHQVPSVTAKIELARKAGIPIDGHAPGLSGRDLSAYIAAGISSDHECTTANEALEKLRLGMHIMIREGSGAKNLRDLLPVVNTGNCHRIMWCTDDRHPHDIMESGHIDDIIRQAILSGMDPVLAIRMATLHPAEYFHLSHLGAIAPGRRADLVVLSDLDKLTIDAVYANGILSAKDGHLLSQVCFPPHPSSPPEINERIRIPDFSIPAESGQLRVIEVIPNQIITRSRIMDATTLNGNAEADPDRDLLKIAVIERHRGTGNIGRGFVTGIGLKRGAIGSSVAHDSHNIIIVGTNNADMKAVLERIIEMNGGLSVACDGKIISDLPLPIGGLMSLEPLAAVRNRLDTLMEKARELGSPLKDPFMTLSFLALPVIPELKITDLGLVDVIAFKPVPLFE